MNNNSPINLGFPNILKLAQEIKVEQEEIQRIAIANWRHFDDIDIDSKLEKILTTHHIEREKIEELLTAHSFDQKYTYLIRILFIHPDLLELYGLFEDFDSVWTKTSNKHHLTQEDNLKRQIILIRNSLRKVEFESQISLLESLIEQPCTLDFFLPFLVDLWSNESLSAESQIQIHRLYVKHLSAPSNKDKLKSLKFQKMEQWIVQGKGHLAVNKLNLEPEIFKHLVAFLSSKPLILADFYCYLYKSQKNYSDRCSTAQELWQILDERRSIEFTNEIYQLAGQMFIDIRSSVNKDYFPKLFPILVQKFHQHHLHKDSVSLILSICPSQASSKKLNPLPPQKILRELKPIWKSIIEYLIETYKDIPTNHSNLKIVLSFVAERHLFDSEYLSKEEISDYLKLIKKLIVVFSPSIDEASIWIKKLCQFPVENLIKDPELEKTIITYLEHEFSNRRFKDLGELLQSLEERVEIESMEVEKLWKRLLEHFAKNSGFDLIKFAQKYQSRLFSKDPKKVSLINCTIEKIKESVECLKKYYQDFEHNSGTLDLKQLIEIKTDHLAYFLLEEFQDTQVETACSLLKLFIHHLGKIDKKLLSAQKVEGDSRIKKVLDSAQKDGSSKCELKTAQVVPSKNQIKQKVSNYQQKSLTPKDVTITSFERLKDALKICINTQSNVIDQDLMVIFEDLPNFMLSSEEKSILCGLHADFAKKLLEKWHQKQRLSKNESSETEMINLSTFVGKFFVRVLKLHSQGAFFTNNVETFSSIINEIKNAWEFSLDKILLKFFLEFNKLNSSLHNQLINDVQVDFFKTRFDTFSELRDGSSNKKPPFLIEAKDYKLWVIAVTNAAHTINWSRNCINTCCDIFRKGIRIRSQWIDKEFFTFTRINLAFLSFKISWSMSNETKNDIPNSLKHYFTLAHNIFDDLLALTHSTASAAAPSVDQQTKKILETCGLIIVELGKKWPLNLEEPIFHEVYFWKMVEKLFNPSLLDDSTYVYTLREVAIRIINKCDDVLPLQERSQKTKYRLSLYAGSTYRLTSSLSLDIRKEILKKFINQLTAQNDIDCIKTALSTIAANFNESFVLDYLNGCLEKFLLSVSNFQPKNNSQNSSRAATSIENHTGGEFQETLSRICLNMMTIIRQVNEREIQVVKQHTVSVVYAILNRFFGFIDNLPNLNDKALCVSKIADSLGSMNILQLFSDEECFIKYRSILTKVIGYLEQDELGKTIKLKSTDFITSNVEFLSSFEFIQYNFLVNQFSKYFQKYHPSLHKENEKIITWMKPKLQESLVDAVLFSAIAAPSSLKE